MSGTTRTRGASFERVITMSGTTRAPGASLERVITMSGTTLAVIMLRSCGLESSVDGGNS